MKLYKHPGFFIREEVLKPRHLTITAAAQLLNVNRPNLSNLINGKISLSKDMAVKFEKAFEVSAEKLLAMQLEFDSQHEFDESSIIQTRPYVAPFLDIHANDIESTFTKSIDMRARLAVFLRILIHSTTAHLSQVDIPGYEDSQKPGWDGWVESQSGSAWVPQGYSGWEFGVNVDIKSKAEKDFEKSVKENSEVQRLSSVFVFVTPRRWINKDKWIDAKKKLNLWKNVVVYDSSDLEQWVENSIEAQVWLANQNKWPSCGVRTLETCWNDWASITDPKLPETLFCSQIKQHVGKINDFLNDSEKKNLIITADSVEEGLAFICQAFIQKFTDKKNRVLVFDRAEVLPKLLLGEVNFIPVIYSRDVEKEFGPYSSKAKSILVYPRNYVLEPDIQLEPLDYQSFKEAFLDKNSGDDWIENQYRRSAGSLTVLHRQLATLPAVRVPEWASQEELGEALVPLMLIGTWDEKNESDKEVVSLLANKEYEEIQRDINRLLFLNDSPIWVVGSNIGVVSKIDSLFAVSRYVTSAQIKTFFEIAQLILSEDDPSLDFPSHLRWSSSLYGKIREFSPQLRKGIAETFVLLVVHGDFLFSSRYGFSCEYMAAHTVNRILLPITSRKLEANSNELPIYAEAAPATFLRIIEDDLKEESPQVIALLKPMISGYFGSSCPRTGLLWALELLAWNADYLPRVAIILARMSQYEINDNWANKPISSLSYILDKWMPQTAASLDKRIGVFDQLFVHYPKVAWQIAISQFNVNTWIGHFTYRAKWRRDSYNHGLYPNVKEGNRFMGYLFNKVVSRLSYSVSMLCDLVSKLRAMDKSQQEKVWRLIDSWASRGQSDEDLAQLREKIRVSVLSRKVRKSAQKLGFTEFTTQAYYVYEKLQPRNVVLKNLWLFHNPWVNESANESLDEEVDYRRREKYVKELRINALFEIVEKEGIRGIIRLSHIGNASYIIGTLLVEADIVSVEEIKNIIVEEANTENELIRGMLETLEKNKLNQLLKELSFLVDRSQLLQIFLLSPYDKNTWDEVERVDQEIKKGYWSKVRPQYRRIELNDFEYGAKKLLAANRPIAAFNSIKLEIEQISPQLIYKLLEAIPNSLEKDCSRSQVDRYDLERALKVIGESRYFTLKQKANIEMFYIHQLSQPSLDDTNSPIPNLENYIELHPEIYAYAICAVYRRDDLMDGNDLTLGTADREAYQLLLETLRQTPGYIEKDVSRSVQKLLEWINQVIEICQRQGRGLIAYRCVGRLLSRSLNGKDGIWPNEQVRGLLEKIDQDDLLEGMRIGRYNNRGPVWRDKGGRQEWQLAKQYREWAEELSTKHLTVAPKLLKRLEKLYEQEAKEFDMREELELRLSSY